MAIREIEYTVSASGIVPAVEQFGGTQNEHRATKLTFRLADELKDKISEYTESGTVVYRFDAYDGEGGLVQGDAQELETDKVLEFYLERWQTEHGGRARVYLVISAVVEGGTETEQKTEMELYSFPAQLRLNNLPDGGTAEDENRESVSALATEAKKNADIAVECKKAAEVAAEVTKPLWGDGTTFVFDGGTDEDGEGEVGADFKIDSQLSPTSENAVQSIEIFSAFESLLNTEYEGEEARANLFTALSEFQQSIIADAKLAAHPIGSYYWSTDDISPDELFGGTWAQVEGKFVFAAGSVTENGATYEFTVDGKQPIVGEVKHTLVVEEIPSHTHTVPAQAYGTDPGLITLSGNSAAASGRIKTSSDGGNVPHNNMPPYEVAYCWKRTA